MKYHNHKCRLTLDNNTYSFDSKAEMNYFVLLHNKLKQGKISDLVLQPEYNITRTFKIATTATKSGKSIVTGLKYTPDFKYIEDGKVIVVEVKGQKTADYQMRKKIFLSRAKDLGVDTFIEVFAKSIIKYDCNSVIVV